MPCYFFATVLVSFSVALITSRLAKNPAVLSNKAYLFQELFHLLILTVDQEKKQLPDKT